MLTVEELVRSCQTAAAEPEPVAAVKVLLERLVSRPSELLAVLDPAPRGISYLYASPELTIQHLVWPPGIQQPPHEHRMWVVAAVVEGQEDNVLYRRSASPDGDLEVVARHQLRAGDVLFIPDDGIHDVANPSRSPTVALHVFGGDIRSMPRSTWDFDGRGERPFDTETINAFVAEAEQQQIALGWPLEFEEVRQLSRKLVLTKPSP